MLLPLSCAQASLLRSSLGGVGRSPRTFVSQKGLYGNPLAPPYPKVVGLRLDRALGKSHAGILRAPLRKASFLGWRGGGKRSRVGLRHTEDTTGVEQKRCDQGEQG